MARLLMAGFETGDTLAYGSDFIGTSGGLSLATSSPTPRSGTYCLKTNLTATSINAWVYGARKSFAHGSKTELWYAFGFYAHHIAETTAPQQALFVARDANSNVNLALALDGGILRAYSPSSGGAAPTSYTLVGTASASTSMDAWHLIEVHLIASTTAGTCELYQDGTQVISVTGVRTAQSGANYGSFELCWFGLSNATSIAGNGTYHAFDDVRVNDTTGSVNTGRPGDGRILALIPNGVGTTLGGTPLTGSPSSTNWQNVDDIPPSATDYNGGTSVGTGETYALSDPTATATAQAVNILAYALNADNGGGNIGITVKTAAGTSEGSSQPITVTSTYYSRLLEADPSDAAAWSNAKLTALEAGITIR